MKPRKTKRQRDIEDPLSRYWMRKTDVEFGKLFHSVPHYCQICNLSKTEMAHLIPRQNYLFRWDMRNIIPLCANHHKWSSEISIHQNPAAFFVWLKKNNPEKWQFLQENKEVITRKKELPWTFKEKFEELKSESERNDIPD